jgi:maltooligosyltrehalose trehalohydrolase
VPLLFQGEEWNASNPFLYFTDHQDETLARLVSDGRRAEFGALGWQGLTVPDPQARDTFQRSCLDWRERSVGEHAAAFEWYRALIRLRRQVPELTALPLSASRVQVDEIAQTLVVERGPLIVACNLSFAAHHVPLDPSACLVLSSDAEIAVEGGLLRLPAESVALALR